MPSNTLQKHSQNYVATQEIFIVFNLLKEIDEAFMQEDELKKEA